MPHTMKHNYPLVPISWDYGTMRQYFSNHAFQRMEPADVAVQEMPLLDERFVYHFS